MALLVGWLIGGWVFLGLLATINLQLLIRKKSRFSTRQRHNREKIWLFVFSLSNLLCLFACALLFLLLTLELMDS